MELKGCKTKPNWRKYSIVNSFALRLEIFSDYPIYYNAGGAKHCASPHGGGVEEGWSSVREAFQTKKRGNFGLGPKWK